MSVKHTPRTNEQILEQLNIEDLAFSMSQLALKILSGKKIDQTEFNVKISLPTEMIDVFKQLADATDTEVEELISSFAKEGFNRAVKARVEEITKPQAPQQSEVPDLEKVLPNFGPGLMQGLDKIREMAGQLSNIQKVMEDAGISTDTKDNQQPDVPTGQDTGSETGE